MRPKSLTIKIENFESTAMTVDQIEEITHVLNSAINFVNEHGLNWCNGIGLCDSRDQHVAEMSVEYEDD